LYDAYMIRGKSLTVTFLTR